MILVIEKASLKVQKKKNKKNDSLIWLSSVSLLTIMTLNLLIIRSTEKGATLFK